MKRVIWGLVLVVFFPVLGAAHIVQAASLEEAKAPAKKAVASFKANGKEKAVAEINDPHSRLFRKYVWASERGLVLANRVNPKPVGMNNYDLRDPSGKYFTREFSQAAKKGGGWVDYVWTDPATKKVDSKTPGLNLSRAASTPAAVYSPHRPPGSYMDPPSFLLSLCRIAYPCFALAPLPVTNCTRAS